MTQSPQSSLASLGLAASAQPPKRLANGEPLGTGGLVTLLAAAVIMLSIMVVTPGLGG